jgi:putative hydrolase of the HAD superfamily
MNVEAVFLDLDATLVAFDREVSDAKNALAWQEVADAAGVDAAILYASHRTVIPNVWWAADARILDAGERVDGLSVMLETYRQALLACACDDESLARRAFDCYWSARHGVFHPFDDVIDVLGQLTGRVRLAVITNGPAITQLDKLEVTGLDHYFDVIVASGDIGVAKPDEAIFRHVLDELRLLPSSAWHVGDSLMHDVAGANNAGLTSVWLNRAGVMRDVSQAAPRHEISSLRELTSLLDPR